MAKLEKDSTREGKAYALKSSASRAAKQDGLVDGEFTIMQSAREDGYYYMKKSVVGATKKPLTDAERKRLRDEAFAGEEDEIVRPPLKIQDYTEPSTIVKEPIEVAITETVYPTANVRSATSPPGGTPLKLVIPPKSPTSKSHKSTVESPTRLVWHIANEMVKVNESVSRKEVIAECERQGIAHFTARTQYQQWLTAKKAGK